MTGPELRRALKTLSWSQKRAAKELAVGGGQQRISDWCRGKKPVPGYIAAHVETHLKLQVTVAHVSDEHLPEVADIETLRELVDGWLNPHPQRE